MLVLNMRWHLMRIPDIPLLKCREALVLMRPSISVFGGIGGMEGVVPEAPYFPCGGPNFYY